MCSGETLANTLILFISFENSSSVYSSISVPIIAWDISSAIPNSLAIANAVVLWSPVIIIGVIPAFLAVSIDDFTSSLGGSIIPTIPIRVKSFSISSEDISVSTSLYASANIRRALFESSSLVFMNSDL